MMMALKLFLLLLTLPLAAEPRWLNAPVADSPPVNQLRTDGNACGPACLLDAFRSGTEKWQKSAAKIKGSTDNSKIRKIIFQYARRGSRLDPKRARWNSQNGVSGIDLVDIANEMRSERWMGTVKQEIFFKKARENDTSLLKRVHKKLSSSLKNGLPPILSVRRVVWRSPHGSTTKSWLTLRRHYLVLTGLPTKLPRNATSFIVTYHDPWGGKRLQGKIHIPDARSTGMNTVIADFPQSNVGQNLVRKGEPTHLSLSSAIGLH